MFWKFNSVTSQHIDTLLNKEDVTLQELMDEEDILQECKVQNKKLIDFLIRPEVLEELVTLITTEPSSELDEKLRYKYSNLACELLTCDVPALNEKLASDEALLNKLYGFLENDPPLNPLLASFVSRTMAILITRKTEQNWYSYQFTCLQVLEYLKSKEEFVSLLLRHLGTSAIMDLLFKLITSVEGADMRQNITSWLDSQQVMQKLVALFSPMVDLERHYNVAQLLCDVIRIARETTYTSQEKTKPDPLVTTLESTGTVTELLNHMFDGEKTESCLVSGILVLLALLELKPNVSSDANCTYQANGHQDASGMTGETEKLTQGVRNTLDAILPQLKNFHDLLLDPPQKSPIKTTIETLDPPLGNTRLHVAKLVAALIATNDRDIQKKIEELGTVDVLLDLFFKYSWNNFLHTQVQHCVQLVLTLEAWGQKEEKIDNPLLVHVLTKCKLVQRILDTWEENEQEQLKPGGHRKGYMGHVTRMANDVAEALEGGPWSQLLHEQLKQMSEETQQKWESFSANILAEINKKNQITLGGARPVLSTSEDEESDFRDIPFPQDTAFQQAFSDYQMQQMAPHFIDQFGFNDDEFNDGEDGLHTPIDRLTTISFSLSSTMENARQTDMFEQMCSQKTRSFDDSDEDIWEDKELTFEAVMDSTSRQVKEPAADASSSDEEDEVREISVPVPTQEVVKMDVDSSDAWAAPAEKESPTVAMDTGNPWGGGAEGGSASDAGWADFSSAEFDGGGGFATFEANFQGAADCEHNCAVAEKYKSNDGAEGFGGSESIKDGMESEIIGEHPVNSPSQQDSVLPDKMVDKLQTECLPLGVGGGDSPSTPVSGMDTSCPLAPNPHPSPMALESDAGGPPEEKLVIAAVADSKDDAELRENFNFLSARGLLKVGAEEEAEGGKAVAEAESIPPPSENGPLESGEGESPKKEAALGDFVVKPVEVTGSPQGTAVQNGPV